MLKSLLSYSTCSVLNSKLAEEDIEEGRMVMELTQHEIGSEVLSRDAAQRAAYANCPLGNLHYLVPEDNPFVLDAIKINEFRSKYFFGENCVLAAAGVEHKSFVALAEKYFSSLPGGNIQVKTSLY